MMKTWRTRVAGLQAVRDTSARRSPQLLLRCSLLLAAIAVAGVAPLAHATETGGAELVAARCGACHIDKGDGPHRIAAIRKSPEGWELTLKRMQTWHGVQLERGEYRTILQYLADTRGLAPSEAAPYRYLLEREPSVQEELPAMTAVRTCTYCHSFGRIALQRRDEAEWRRLVHMHLGQWPGIELHGASRGIAWRDIALSEVPAELAQRFPLATPAWEAWRPTIADANSGRTPAGEWRVWGNHPAHGDYTGTLRIDARAGQGFALHQQIRFPAGDAREGDGSGLLYTGYEWRASGMLGEQKLRQVLALSEDGNRLDGRWYDASHPEIGASLHAVRIVAGHSAIIAIAPAALEPGKSATLTIHGFGLEGAPDLGPGIEIGALLAKDERTLAATVRVRPDAVHGKRDVSVGSTRLEGGFAVIPRIDRIEVSPRSALSRNGEEDSSPPMVETQFAARGFWNGADGQAGTADDIDAGTVAVRWSLEPWDETARRFEDTRFAGAIDANGLFVPAGGGPNEQRKLKANNVGNLRVVATWSDGRVTLNDAAHLIVTAPKWVNAPIE